jgi:uncharacterized protein YggL (DUF469 family)
MFKDAITHVQNSLQSNTDDEDDDENYEDYEDFLGNADKWEDIPEFQRIRKAMPAGWLMVKMVNFTHSSMSEIDQWLKTQPVKKFKKIGFTTGCSYSVAVQFESHVDAVMFKMRWS